MAVALVAPAILRIALLCILGAPQFLLPLLRRHRQPLFQVNSSVVVSLRRRPLSPKWRGAKAQTDRPGLLLSPAMLMPIAAVLFLSLKIVVLPVADGRRPGRKTAAFQPG